MNTSKGKKFIQLAVTKAELINLEFGERNSYIFGGRLQNMCIQTDTYFHVVFY